MGHHHTTWVHRSGGDNQAGTPAFGPLPSPPSPPPPPVSPAHSPKRTQTDGYLWPAAVTRPAPAARRGQSRRNAPPSPPGVPRRLAMGGRRDAAPPPKAMATNLDEQARGGDRSTTECKRSDQSDGGGAPHLPPAHPPHSDGNSKTGTGTHRGGRHRRLAPPDPLDRQTLGGARGWPSSSPLHDATPACLPCPQTRWPSWQGRAATPTPPPTAAAARRYRSLLPRQRRVGRKGRERGVRGCCKQHWWGAIWFSFTSGGDQAHREGPPAILAARQSPRLSQRHASWLGGAVSLRAEGAATTTRNTPREEPGAHSRIKLDLRRSSLPLPDLGASK